MDAALYRDFLSHVMAEDLRLHFFESTREASHEVLDKVSAKIRLVPWPPLPRTSDTSAPYRTLRCDGRDLVIYFTVFQIVFVERHHPRRSIGQARWCL
jgi:hypothetical protein